MERFERLFDLEQHLWDHRTGWRRSKKKSTTFDEEWVKRIGGVWIAIKWGRDFGSTILIQPSKMPFRNLDRKKWDEAYDLLTKEYRITGKTLADIERAAQDLVKDYKRMAPRKRKDYTESSWRGYRGEEAIRKWKETVEETLLDILGPHTTYRKESIWTTKELIHNLLDNYGIDYPIGLERRDVGVQVKAILERLARRGKIDKLTGGRYPDWGVKRASSRVVDRFQLTVQESIEIAKKGSKLSKEFEARTAAMRKVTPADLMTRAKRKV